MRNIEEVAPSSADLMLDMLSGYGAEGLSVQALCRTGAIMGMTESNVRVALTRLVQQHKIRSAGRGAYAIAMQGDPLHDDVDHWWQKEDRLRPWSGEWIAVHVPHGSVSARNGLRRHERALILRGFQCFKPGLHLRPDNLTGGVAELRRQLLALGLSPASLVLGAKELAPPEDAAARALWPIDELISGYRDLLARLANSLARMDKQPLEIAAKEVLLLGRLVIKQILRDPLLPSEMMPGEQRKALTQAMRGYQVQARELWVRVLAS